MYIIYHRHFCVCVCMDCSKYLIKQGHLIVSRIMRTVTKCLGHTVEA